MAVSFKQKIIGHLTHNGKTGRSTLTPHDPGPDEFMLQDDSDGRGPFIRHWGANLGPKPTEAEGFAASELRAPRAPEEIKAEVTARIQEAKAQRDKIHEDAKDEARKLNRDGSTVGWLGIARDKIAAAKRQENRKRL